MRQAGRYLPEYRELRRHHTFQEAISTPALAAEISLQPVRRFALDGAVIFADIMTPLQAMGIVIEFDPGPRLTPLTLDQVSNLRFDLDQVDFVAETIARVRRELPPQVAVIGFAGAPLTLLAYLLEGGSSRDFLALRAAALRDPPACKAALQNLAAAMNAYLRLQAEAGADVVQVFDTWAGLLDRRRFQELAAPAARATLAGLGLPRISFAPGAAHTLDLQPGIGAEGYSVDWRLPILSAWEQLGEVAVQGNLDPALLLTDPATVAAGVARLLDEVGDRPGHIASLGHGIDPATPVENVAALVESIHRHSP
jgi:uroporphyrinogen decarboxylase